MLFDYFDKSTPSTGRHWDDATGEPTPYRSSIPIVTFQNYEPLLNKTERKFANHSEAGIECCSPAELVRQFHAPLTPDSSDDEGNCCDGSITCPPRFLRKNVPYKSHPVQEPLYNQCAVNLTCQTLRLEKYLWSRLIDGEIEIDPEPNVSTQIMDTFPPDLFMPRHINCFGLFRKQEEFWMGGSITYNFLRTVYESRYAEYSRYQQLSFPTLNFTNPTNFEVLHDSKLQHPNSKFVYSVLRTSRIHDRRRRRKTTLKYFDVLFPLYMEMVESAMLNRHDLIIIEPSVMGELMEDRVAYGFDLCLCCGILCIWSYLSASYRAKYPGLFLLPCFLANYLAYVYCWEYRTDNTTTYTTWSSWVNDIEDCEFLPEIQLPVPYLREESLAFMQYVDLKFRKKINAFATNVANYYCFKAWMDRIELTDVVADMSWELTKRRICEGTGRHVEFIMGKLDKRCTYESGQGFINRMVAWLGTIGLFFFAFSPLFWWLKRMFYFKSRMKRSVNWHFARAVRGERRYIRMSQSLYWYYRHRYPRDCIGVRDTYYLSHRYRNAPGSHHFIY